MISVCLGAASSEEGKSCGGVGRWFEALRLAGSRLRRRFREVKTYQCWSPTQVQKALRDSLLAAMDENAVAYRETLCEMARRVGLLMPRSRVASRSRKMGRREGAEGAGPRIRDLVEGFGRGEGGGFEGENFNDLGQALGRKLSQPKTRRPRVRAGSPNFEGGKLLGWPFALARTASTIDLPKATHPWTRGGSRYGSKFRFHGAPLTMSKPCGFQGRG